MSHVTVTCGKLRSRQRKCHHRTPSEGARSSMAIAMLHRCAAAFANVVGRHEPLLAGALVSRGRPLRVRSSCLVLSPLAWRAAGQHPLSCLPIPDRDAKGASQSLFQLLGPLIVLLFPLSQLGHSTILPESTSAPRRASGRPLDGRWSATGRPLDGRWTATGRPDLPLSHAPSRTNALGMRGLPFRQNEHFSQIRVFRPEALSLPSSPALAAARVHLQIDSIAREDGSPWPRSLPLRVPIFWHGRTRIPLHMLCTC